MAVSIKEVHIVIARSDTRCVRRAERTRRRKKPPSKIYERLMHESPRTRNIFGDREST